MRILLTGATGFLGAEILANLMERKEKVTVVAWGRNRKRIEALQTRFAAHSACLKIEECELLESRPLSSDVDVIIHAAALRPPTAGQDPAELSEVNVGGTRHVVQLAEHTDCHRLIYISTQAVYGCKGAPWAEDAPLRPETPYAASKHAGEVEVLQADGIDGAILRVSRLYGVTPFTRWTELPGRFATAVCHGEPLTVHGTGEQRIDFVHVRDVAQAVVLAALSPKQRVPRIYNVGGGRSVSLNEFCEIFSTLAFEHGMPDVTVRREPNHDENRSWHSELDVSKIKNDLGWVPRVSLVEGLRDYLSCVTDGC